MDDPKIFGKNFFAVRMKAACIHLERNHCQNCCTTCTCILHHDCTTHASYIKVLCTTRKQFTVSTTEVEILEPLHRVTVLHFSGAIAPKNSPSVRPSVQKLQRTALRISTKLGSKLEDNQGRKLTEPFFPGKIWIIQ